MKQQKVPLWQKYNLTLAEASEYFNIGDKKLRQLVHENSTADFILNSGRKILIKRLKFEAYIDEVYSI